VNNTADQQLLREYAERRSEGAFNELVRRYVDFVYSVALRIVRDPHRAEDVTQGVFVAVARNAGKLAGQQVLGGWLHRTTRNIAANAIRAEVRRQTREQEVASMNVKDHDAWEEIAAHLDAALGSLGEPDRDAVLLRYFQKKSLVEVGTALGVTEDAAQKRVSRALERLRHFFEARGVTVGVSGLAAALSVNAVHAAPASVAVVATTAATLGGMSLTAAGFTSKVIAMTTLQKTTVVVALALTAGFGVREFRENSRLRAQVRALQEQHAAVVEQLRLEQQAEPAPANAASSPAPVMAAPAATTEAQWAARLMGLNTNDWRRAFAVGQQLAALPAERGWNLLQANWNAITNVSARQQLLKAFAFADHERLPAVLHTALIDSSPEVQNWALVYLKSLALQDFSTDYQGALGWIAARTHLPTSAAFADAVLRASSVLRQAQGEELHAQLSLLKEAGSLFSKFPESVAPARLDEVLATIIHGNDAKAAALAVATAGRLQLDDRWRQQVILPKLGAGNPGEVRTAAARALGLSKSEWAVDPLLNTLSAAVHSPKELHLVPFASALSDLGSPRAIPQMIALLEADRSGRAVYDIGYFGLSKLTGVAYDEKHNGAWWQAWWEANKQRFPADVQALEIPRLPQSPAAQARTEGRSSTAR
jgi:RNA polymerase sigma factor (sigma-70 family)